jgi:arylsulfatase A-like enzyme
MKLLVLVPRGLRADMLGPYGNRWIDTPNFDILAANGAVFDLHFSVHPDEAHAVWRSGRYQFHRGEGGLLAPLAAAGIQTRLVLDTSRSEPEGFAAGWGEVRRCNGLEATLKQAKAQLRELLKSDDWLLWAEFASLLPPWRIASQFLDQVFEAQPIEQEEDEDEDDEEEDEDEGQGLELLPEEEPLEPLLEPSVGAVDAEDDHLFLRAQTTMAAAVSQLDAVMGELLDGLPDDVTLLVTTDQGLPLGEHGWPGPGDGRLFDSRTQVPLILVGPGWRPGSRTAALTASIDIAPTVAAMFGVEVPAAHGASLLPLAGRRDVWGREYVCLGGEGEKALRSAEWLLRKPDDGPPALYEKPADRNDRGDLSQPNFGVVEQLEKTLTAFVEATASPGPFVAPALEAEASE